MASSPKRSQVGPQLTKDDMYYNRKGSDSESARTGTRAFERSRGRAERRDSGGIQLSLDILLRACDYARHLVGSTGISP
jgi:hypothetical protein